jgi:hypothetical protein
VGHVPPPIDGRDRYGPAAALLRKLERALESMVVDLDLTTPAALDAAAPIERAPR